MPFYYTSVLFKGELVSENAVRISLWDCIRIFIVNTLIQDLKGLFIQKIYAWINLYPVDKLKKKHELSTMIVISPMDSAMPLRIRTEEGACQNN